MHVRVNTDHILGLLPEKKQFNIARKYAELVNSTSSQITIKEVCTVLYSVMHINSTRFGCVCFLRYINIYFVS